MNQEHIGKFISKERKKKNLTQKELSEKLRISEKTISKWECGKGLPEVSLMKPLCKELDITVTELLNGYRDIKDEKTKEDGIINYIGYTKKKSHRKLIILSILSVLLITFILSTVCYFFNTFNKIVVYELNGENENFSIVDLYVTKSNIYNILYTGQINLNNMELNKEDIIYVELKCENTTIYGATTFENNIQKEKYGYNNIFNDNKLKNIDKWEIEITYKENGEKKVDTIYLNSDVLIRNNEFISMKAEEIGNLTDNYSTEEEMDILKNRMLIRSQALLEAGYNESFMDESNNLFAIYEKDLNNNETIKIRLTASYYPEIIYSYTLKENETIRIEERLKKDNLTKNISGYIDLSDNSYSLTFDIDSKQTIIDSDSPTIEIENIEIIMTNYIKYRQDLYNILNKPFE